MDDLQSVESSIPERMQKQKRAFSFLTGKSVPPIPLKDERKQMVNVYNVFNLFFGWVHPTLRVGYKRTIQPSDLPYLRDELKTESLYKNFEFYFNKYNDICKTNHLNKKYQQRGETAETSSVDRQIDLQDYVFSKTYVMLTIAMSVKRDFLFAILSASICDAMIPFISLLTKALINFVSEKTAGVDITVGRGIGYAIGAVILSYLSFFLLSVYFFFGSTSAIQAKAVLTKAILTKAFKAGARGKHNYPTSRLTTLVGTDLAKLDLALLMAPNIFSAPLSFIISIVLLAINLGAATAVSIGIIFLTTVVFAFIASSMAKFRKKSLSITDKRVNFVKEIINNLKIIKFYSWEDSYEKNVVENRVEESKLLMQLQNYRSAAIIIILSLTAITSMATFLVLYAIGGSKNTPANIFASINLLSLLGNVFVTLPYSINSVIDGTISARRVFGFLVCEESFIQDNVIINADESVTESYLDQTVIKVENASFEWETFPKEEEVPTKQKKSRKFWKKKVNEPEELTQEKDVESSEIKINKVFPGLRNINLKIKNGEFVMIVGEIGTGKTSLLNALTGFMKRTEGEVEINGSALLCGNPWVQNATIKQNVLFGKPFDEKRYEQAIFACALNEDLRVFPAGDATEVGERGITLSGGQKSRLSLARAIYAASDVLFLDDVLSAVDARVGKHIMELGLLGLLKESTRVLATHQLSFLSYADRVIYLAGDGSIDVGTVDDLSQRNEGFQTLLLHKDRDDKDEQSDDSSESSKEEEEQQIAKTQVNEIKEIDMNLKLDGKLIESEVSAENSVSWDVYMSFFKFSRAPPVVLICLTILSTALTSFTGLFVNTWLSFWLEYKFPNKTDSFYMGIYVMLSLLTVIFTFIQFILYVNIVLLAARRVNINAIKRILHVPMSFMDTTPTGRILNRFTKDTDSTDNELIENLRMGLYMFAQIIGVLILTIIYLPWLAIAIPFLFMLVFMFGSYYQASAREIKRLEATQRSLYLNNFSESLNGMETIKAYGDERRFIMKNDILFDHTNEAAYNVNAIQRWAGLRVNEVAILYTLLITLLCIFRVFNISPASVGLVVSYIFVIPNSLSNMIRSLSMAENEMTSYERIYEYACKLPQEAAYHKVETKPKEEWPAKGHIIFDNVSMRYREGLPKVMNNVSFEVRSNERIGICGRTGAGKSTVVSTLFRLTEFCEGKIYIDGVDISTLGLHELRSKLSIIPQESVLFSGTIRKNLDPFSEVDDETLWQSLRRAGLVDEHDLEAIRKQTDPKGLHKFHLDSLVEDNGSNFSLGEKQLLAFARALVKNSRILVLDEATSSVDYKTDSKIQETIVREFKDCTILAIAHRLRTIINYDKILVLDNGSVKEFDTPRNLFDDENSIFRSLCDKSKITEEEFL